MKPRLVNKARSKKQQASIAAYKVIPAPFVPPAAAGLPTRSWWTEARDREEFDRLAREEQERMRLAGFARRRGPLHGGL